MNNYTNELANVDKMDALKKKQNKTKWRNQAQYWGGQSTQEVVTGIKPYCSHKTQLRLNSKLFWKIENGKIV